MHGLLKSFKEEMRLVWGYILLMVKYVLSLFMRACVFHIFKTASVSLNALQDFLCFE